jgi:PKD repeat protein
VAEAMTVGATDRTDRRAYFSNYGSCVDWFAPGVSITSAWSSGDSDVNTISGTSMASPHTAGVAALYLQANPGASPAQVQTALADLTTKGIVTNAASANSNLLYNGGGVSSPPPNQAPVASFTSSCTNLGCSFDASASSDDGSIASYAWTFGDGGTATGVTASHTYASANSYTVTLTVTDNLGATGNTSSSVTVTAPPSPNPAPVASFTSSCTNLGCSFDATASSDDGSIASYAWTFGDGGTASGVTASHTYASANSYTVTLTVTDNLGATGSTSSSVTVSAPPPPPAGAIYVSAISFSSRVTGKNTQLTVTVTVRQAVGGTPDANDPVFAGATVGGTLTGPGSSSALNGTSGSNGQVSWNLPRPRAATTPRPSRA